MSRLMVRNMVLAWAVVVVGTCVVNASPPENDDNSGSSTTVTETETEASLTGAAAQTTAKGYAESKVVSVTDNTSGTTTTNSSLTVSAKRLTLADGSVVTFQLNGNTIGTGTVKKGQAKLRLSTKSGNTVPSVSQGDTLTVIDPDGSTVDLTGAFGAPHTETESGN